MVCVCGLKLCDSEAREVDHLSGSPLSLCYFFVHHYLHSVVVFNDTVCRWLGA